MGVAGSGKSVQGRLLSDALGYPWVSTGEILRQHISGEKRQRMLEGELLTGEELYEVVEPVLRQHINDGELKVILDGFPRTQPQAEWLQQFAAENNIKIRCILRLEADEEEVTRRLLERGRQDDTAEVIARRFVEYERMTKPILDFYEKRGVPSPIIDGNGSEQEVAERIQKALEENK